MLGEGDWFGQPFKLRRWQKAFIYRLYELNSDGSRRYRKALLGVPKNNGKTPLAAAIAAYELLGPDHISPLVALGAASYEQANLVFDDLRNNFAPEAPLAPYASAYEGNVTINDRPGKAKRIYAVRGSNDGQRPSCFIADELHEWMTPAQEGCHLVLANGCTKRENSLQLNITTAGFDLESLLGRMYLHGQRVLAGEVEDPTFLFEWHEAADRFDLDDPVQLRAAIESCNPAAGDFLRVDDVIRRFYEIPRFEAERYFLNRWTRAPECWLPAGAWEHCNGSAEIPVGADVAVGVDVALKYDHTAVVVAHKRSDGTFAVQSKVWEPVDAQLDVGQVMAHVRHLASTYRVRGVSYDPRFFDLPAMQLADEGILMVEQPQSAERMVPACKHAYELIAAGKLAHGGDPVLTDHVLSAVQREGDRGWILSKGRSKRKIDACIAMVLALWEAAQDTGSVYDTRGLLVLG